MGGMQSPVTTHRPGVQSGLLASGLGQLYHGVGHESWELELSQGVGGSGLGLTKEVLEARLGIMEWTQWVSVRQHRLFWGSGWGHVSVEWPHRQDKSGRDHHEDHRSQDRGLWKARKEF